MIEVEHLSKRYGSFQAVRDLSFEVERGTVVGFLGPNGAGKSTTLRIVAGYLGATSGSVRIGGHDIVEERMQALGLLGYMPETSPLYPEMRVSEYLRFRAELKGVGRRSRAAEVERAAELAGVDHMLQVVIGHLSKGYRQRVGLADALLGSPPLIILDEPSAGLDPNQIREVRALVRQLAQEHTVLLSTHILPEVEATCDRAIVLNQGRLVAAGPIGELQREHGDARAKLLLRADKSAALKLLKGHERVRSAEAEDSNEDGLVEVTVTLRGDATDSGEAVEQLVFALAEARMGLRRLTPMTASLEHVFSQLTLRDESEDDDTSEDGGAAGNSRKAASADGDGGADGQDGSAASGRGAKKAKNKTSKARKRAAKGKKRTAKTKEKAVKEAGKGAAADDEPAAHEEGTPAGDDEESGS